MNIIKSEKGVTILALTITIIVIVIITGTLIYNANNQLHIKKIDNLYSDIEQIRDKVSNYYIKYGKLPVKGRYCTANELTEILKQNGAGQTKNQNDLLDINDKKDSVELTYYVIDLSKLDNLTLYYGSKFKDWTPNVEVDEENGEETYSSSTTEQDLYIINEKSQQIYYPKGITVEDKFYYAHRVDLNASNSAELEVTNIPNLSISKVIFQNADEQAKIYLIKDGKIEIKASTILKVPNDNAISHVYYSIVPKVYDGEKTFKESLISEITEDDDVNNKSYNISITSDKITSGDYYLWFRIIDRDGNEYIGYKSNENSLEAENEIVIEEKEIDITVPHLSANNTEKQVDVTIKYDAEHLNNVKFSEGLTIDEAKENFKAIQESDPYETAEDGDRVYTLVVSRDEYLCVKAKDQYGNEYTFYKTVIPGDFDRNITAGKIDVVWIDTANNVIQQPNAPVLSKTVSSTTYALTPVKYNSSKTDHWEAVTNMSEEWYKYTIQSDRIEDAQRGTSRWANARANDGSLFVWIPRYAYKITYYDDRGNEIGYSTTKGIVNSRGKVIYESDSDYASREKVKTSGYEDYIVHPAFTKTENAANGGGWSKEIPGLWIGKFEAQNNGGYVQVIAGKTSWRFLHINQMYNYGQMANYGYSNYNNTIFKSHLIKNSEWGAVAYLAHSQYGLRGGKVMKNTSSDYYAGGSDDKSTIYNANIYQSTTHNEYGIFDLNGGAYECTASYVNNGHENLTNNGNYDPDSDFLYKLYGTSEEEQETSTEYKTVYSSTATEGASAQAADYSLNSKVKGDCTFEVSSSYSGSNSWNSAYSIYPSSFAPFYMYGGNYSGTASGSGSFCFNISRGGTFEYVRI